MTSHPAAAPLTFSVLAAGSVAFLTLGVLQAMYGPAFGLFQAHYGVDIAEVGLIASAHFLGTALGPPVTGAFLARQSVRWVVVGSLLVLAAGVSLVAFAPSWWLAVAGALVGGLGLGSVSAALNAAYAALGTQAVNLVNAMFGVGSILSPMLVATLGVQHLGWPFLVVVGCAALTLVAARVWGFPSIPTAASVGTRPQDEEMAIRQATTGHAPGGNIAIPFAALLFCYVSLEVGFGAWSGKYLESLHVGHIPLILSLYWGGLTVGRILTGLFGGKVAPRQLVMGMATGALVCAALVALGQPTLSMVAVVVMGLMLGPVFGTSLAWMTQHLQPRLIPFLMITGSAGGTVVPALLGILFHRFGPGAVPVGLLVLAALLFGVIQLTARMAQAQQSA